MLRSRQFARGLLVVLVVAGCVVLTIAPLLQAPANAAPPSAPAPSDIVVNQFRFGTSTLETDEFIELFNRSCTNTVDLNGWTVEASKASTTVVLKAFLTSTPLGPGQYFLLASSSFDTNNLGVADAIYDPTAGGGVDSTLGGVALFKPGTSGAVDQVGFHSDGYFEGTPITPQSTGSTQGYQRRTASSMVVDTNNNIEDFLGPVDVTYHSQKLSSSGTCGIPTVHISGNAGIDGAVLKYDDQGPLSVTADASGHYDITLPANWSGTITPTKPGYSFVPHSRPYANVLSDVIDQNFTPSFNTPTRTPVPGYLSVVINEVGWAGTQYSASDQWIELFNTTSHPIDLTDWELIGTSGTIGTNGVLTLDGVIPAKGFYIIEKRSDIFESLPSGVVEQADNHLALSTYGEALTLDSSTGVLVDTANHTYGRWPAGLNTYSTNRASMERHSPSADVSTNWFTFAGTPHIIIFDKGGNVVKGTPGQANWAYSVTATPSPVPTKYKTATPRPPTPFAHMVVNEFLPRAGTDWNQDKKVDVFDEFIEVKNLGPIDVDLRGWKLDIISSGGNTSYFLPSTKLTTGQRAVFYRSSTQLAMPDSGGTVRLTNTRSIVIDARSYGPVENPDQSICRLPDGFYWRFPCFPTPGNENSLTGVAPVPPPSGVSTPPPCLMADIIPAPFRNAECYGSGADIFNANYWDDQAGFNDFPVLDLFSKWRAVVK